VKLLTHYLHSQKHQPSIKNWRENSINDHLFYSFRSTDYSKLTYPASIHYHDYYELVLFLDGDIHYLCESEVFTPKHGELIVIPPGKLHMSMINSNHTHYTRHVFYLYPDALDGLGCGILTTFLKRSAEGRILRPANPGSLEELLTALCKLDQSLAQSTCAEEKALSIGCVIQIFYLLNHYQFEKTQHADQLPHVIRQIQQYLDANFAEINSVSEVAKHFYYSREYLSRIFHQYFNTTVADYLTKRRVAYSQTLIAEGRSLSEAGFQSGYSNQNTFIRAFKSVTGMTPSAYRKALDESNHSS